MTPPHPRRTIAAGMIGNLLEWYDFAIYGYFAATIGKVFFPAEDPLAQVLAAFGVFALGYLMRPLGGIVVGHIGDRFGRRAALTFSIAAMALPTFLVGILPGHETLGVAAPILLTLLRMIQGLSVGGEACMAMVFLVEQAPPGRRGLAGSMASLAATGGFLLGSTMGAAFAALLPAEALAAWGWRIPFLLGLAVGVVGWWIRRLPEAEPPRPRTATKSPLIDTLTRHPRSVLQVAGVAMFGAVGFYLMFLYIVTWLQTVEKTTEAQALEVNTISMLALMPIAPLAGWLGDRFGRRPVVFTALVAGFLFSWPLLWLMHHPSFGMQLAGQLGFVVIAGIFLGIMPALLTEAVPTSVRCTAVALGYNIAFGIVGGLTPLVATWLVARSHMDLSPAFLLMAAAAISFLTLLTFRETSRDATLRT
jgi:MHS family proline/betaine transporter-like MFS transporter